MLTLLANMDIQGCTSKHGVVSYMTKYITHHGAKNGSPQVAAEKELDACLSRAQDEGKGPRLGITRWFNAQVAPGILTQLEACRVNWGFERYLSSRDFFALRLKDDANGVKTPGDVAAAAAAGEDISILRSSLLQRYESRCARNLPPASRPTPVPWGGFGVPDLGMSGFGHVASSNGPPWCRRAPPEECTSTTRLGLSRLTHT